MGRERGSHLLPASSVHFPLLPRGPKGREREKSVSGLINHEQGLNEASPHPFLFFFHDNGNPGKGKNVSFFLGIICKASYIIVFLTLEGRIQVRCFKAEAIHSKSSINPRDVNRASEYSPDKPCITNILSLSLVSTVVMHFFSFSFSLTAIDLTTQTTQPRRDFYIHPVHSHIRWWHSLPRVHTPIT